MQFKSYNLCHKFTKMYLFILELHKKSAIQNYNYVIKSVIQTQFMAFYIRKSCKFMSFICVMNYNFYKLYVIKYIMSFKNISSEEYDRLIKNKNIIFYMTFKNPNVLNKYRNNKNIHNEIKQSKN